MISSSRPASANWPTNSPPPTSQMFLPLAALTMSSCTGRTSPLTNLRLASRIGVTSWLLNTQAGTSP
jgi:hypothetical protein